MTEQKQRLFIDRKLQWKEMHMAIGLMSGVVELADHDAAWETVAAETIRQLWGIFGARARDIQHVGSTAIRHIKAKPIIDIAVAVDDFANVEALIPALEANGFMHREWVDDTQMLFDVGENVGPGERFTTHFIHVVKADSTEWYGYINFRDYLNASPSVAKEYEALKVRLATENPYDKDREKYLAGKHDFLVSKVDEAQTWADSGMRLLRQ